MLERIPISKWKVPMIAFTMTMVVAGYVRTSMHAARREAQVERQRKLDEVIAARRARITQSSSKPG
jgi:phage-related minor tail protein